MKQTELIETLVSYIDARTTAEVRVSGLEDERPVPLVLIEDWDTVDHNYENTNFVGVHTDPSDGQDKKYHRFYYTTRVELLIRDGDDVGAHELLDELRDALVMIQANPTDFHAHLNEAKMGGAGGIDHQFIESKETELHQAVRFFAFHDVTEDSFDTIQSITNNIIAQ